MMKLTLVHIFLSWHSICAIFRAILNFRYGRSTASTQYFMQLARYLGIPVISWNADSSGLETIMCHFLQKITKLLFLQIYQLFREHSLTCCPPGSYSWRHLSITKSQQCCLYLSGKINLNFQRFLKLTNFFSDRPTDLAKITNQGRHNFQGHSWDILDLCS